MRLDRHDLAFHGQHFGDGAAGQRVQLRPRRRQQERARLGEVVERLPRGVIQSARSVSVLSPSARWPSGNAPTKK